MVRIVWAAILCSTPGAGRLGQQDAGVREPGGVELHKFDVLQLQTGGQGQGHAVAGQIPGI